MKNIFPGERKNKEKEGGLLQTTGTSPPNSLVRQTWLHYFNNYLREHRVITEEEWRKMRHLIGGN